MNEKGTPKIDLTKEATTHTADLSAPEDHMDTQTIPALAADRAEPPSAANGAPATTPVPRRAEPRGVRVGTVVWGLVIAAIGVGLLAYAIGVAFDVQLALIVLVAAAGGALLVGSLVTGFRRRGRAEAGQEA